MKKKLFIHLFLLSALSVSAQIPVGSWYTGGSAKVGFNTADNGDNKTTELKFSPQTFVQLNNHWAIGGGVFIATEINKFTPTGLKTTTIDYGIRPGVRYYGNILQAVICYLQGSAGYSGGFTKTVIDSFDAKDTHSSFGFSVVPGISWKIKDRVFVDLSYGNLAFTHLMTKPEGSDESDASNSFCLSLKPKHISLGLFYIFGRVEEEILR